MYLRKFSYVLLIMVFISCKEKKKEMPSEKVIHQTLQKANKQIASEQKLLIESYIKRRKWNMNKTGSGLYYMILDSSNLEKKIQTGDFIKLTFSLSTIEGNEIFSRDNPRTLELNVENSNAESGIHELVQKMRKGERAIAILPSHLAFGLTGEENIPPFAVLVYNLKVINPN